ncbi:MAG: hypothetical protein A3I66_03645 [Burkholderiales bacterium RIFCSPLOWO2_02_FULL_57_36]|nr:MAG: hypothetical protein A3I66_03645 [Burkholderiales bacterium RIFCSPLOWO2_02_FULL_57_36]
MLRRFLFALLIGVSGASSALESLSTAIQRVELVTVGTPQVKMPFEWSAKTKDVLSGYLDIGLGREFSDHFTMSEQHPKLLLHVTPKQKDAQIRVRQRSVTYLNVSGEGPHIAVRGTDVASSWVELRPTNSTAFLVVDQVPQKLNMTGSQIVSAVKDTAPDWVEIAKTCVSDDDGACYTVTDTEFEISVKTGNIAVSKGIVRVLYPNGC